MITLKMKNRLYKNNFGLLRRVNRSFFSSQPPKPISYYYKILGVKPGFTPQQLKSAYLQMVKKYHPDLSKQPNAAQKFQEVQAAYDYLQDTKKLKQQQRQQSRQSQQGLDQQKRANQFNEIFRQAYSKKQHVDESMQFSYNLYKKHYEKVQQKKKQYVKYHGHERQQWAHKDQKQENLWPTIGVGAFMVALVAGGIYFVNTK